MSQIQFQFNFNQEIKINNPLTSNYGDFMNQEDPLEKNEKVSMREAKQHYINPNTSSFPYISTQIGENNFYLVNTETSDIINQTGSIQSILTASDIETGVYEGGLKLWECTNDLVLYLQQHMKHVLTKECKVLELGCGHGLPGIYTLQQGVEQVVFTDYNDEVLDLVTCPNVCRNVLSFDSVRFFSGDWDNVSQKHLRSLDIPNGSYEKFDLILTAETIYTPSITLKLYQTIQKHLSYPHGIALIAAKKYYFGTGGSMNHLQQLIEQQNVFEYKIVFQVENYSSNIREILYMSYKK